MKREIVISFVAALVRKSMHGRHADRDLKSKATNDFQLVYTTPTFRDNFAYVIIQQGCVWLMRIVAGEAELNENKQHMPLRGYQASLRDDPTLTAITPNEIRFHSVQAIVPIIEGARSLVATLDFYKSTCSS